MTDDLPRTYDMSTEQAATFSNRTRDLIMTLLAERPATISQLAEALGKAKGTVGHHVGVLADLGLIRVVRTRKVRAITEKYYGRIAHTYVFPHHEGTEGEYQDFFLEAMSEMREPGEGEPNVTTIRHARIPNERAREWEERLMELAEEFAAQPRAGTTTYGLVVSLYATDLPSLPPDDEGDS
jgi:DNA-binding transcriptional ArsR family regulator